MDLAAYQNPLFAVSRARNEKEALIEDIVAACSGNRRQIAKQLALAYNTLHWTMMDLHTLYAKRNDPKIRNYAAFVVWSTKIRKYAPSGDLSQED